MAFEIMTGTVEGKGSNVTVSLGFVPDYVKLINIDDTANHPIMERTSDMADGSAIKWLSISGSGTGVLTHDIIATLGVYDYAGSTTAAAGFTIGADTDMNVDAETIAYIAIKTR